jgi:hypothetical protein
MGHRRVTITEAAIVAATLLAMAVVIAGAVMHGRPRHGAVPSCNLDLERLSAALDLYEGEHGANPDRLSVLWPDHLMSMNALVFPASNDVVGDPQDLDQWTSYAYRPIRFGREETARFILEGKEPSHDGISNKAPIDVTTDRVGAGS